MRKYFNYLFLIALYSIISHCNNNEFKNFKEVPFIHEYWTKHTHVKINIKTKIYSKLADKNEIDYCPVDTITKIQKFASFFYKFKNQMLREDRILITCGIVTGWIQLNRKNLTIGDEATLLKIIGKNELIEKFKRRMTGLVTLRYFRLAFTNDLNVYLAFVDSNSSITELFPEFTELEDNKWLVENENTILYISKTRDSYIFEVKKDKKNKFKFLNNQEFKLDPAEI